MPSRERWPTRFEKCHLCGASHRGHYPICAGCYKSWLVDGKPPEWLRFLINDLKRENRDQKAWERHTVPMEDLDWMEDESARIDWPRGGGRT